jgi:hypothetical protein
MITLPVIFATSVVIILEWGSTCRMVNDAHGNVDPISLHAFFILKVVTALTTWTANAVMSRKAGDMYDECIGPQKQTVKLVAAKEMDIRTRSAGRKSKLLSLLDKRTLIDAALEAGLKMIIKRDDLLTSWIYRIYQLCFLPDMAMDLAMLVLLSRFIAVDQAECRFDENENSLRLLMALALWAAVTLAFRTAIVSTWLARVLFFADKAGLYHWGFKYAKHKDESLFFGSEVASKTYASLYSRRRKERIEAKLKPLQARTHEALLKLNIFELTAQRRLHRQEFIEVEKQLEEFTARYNDIYEHTGNKFSLDQHGEFEHTQTPEALTPSPPPPQSKDSMPDTDMSTFGYRMFQSKQGRVAPTPSPPTQRDVDGDEWINRKASAASVLSVPRSSLHRRTSTNPFQERLNDSMTRAVLLKQRQGDSASSISEIGEDTVVHVPDLTRRIPSHGTDEFFDTFSGDEESGHNSQTYPRVERKHKVTTV